MNCIIVEDEFPAREELKYFIKNHSDIEIINDGTNKEAIREIVKAISDFGLQEKE